MTRSPTLAPLVLVSLGLMVAALTASEPRAWAQDQQNQIVQATVDKLVAMNKKALEDYDTLEWDAAKRALLEALVTGKKAGLENHPVMARTYVHLGAVYITGFKDKQKGLQSFVRALEIDPSIKISKTMITAELSDVFAEAAKQAKPRNNPPAAGAVTPAAPPAAAAHKHTLIMEKDAPAPPPSHKAAPSVPPPPPEDDSGEPDLPVHITALDCPNVDEAPPDKSLTLRCAVAPNLAVAKIFLMYREPSSEDFTTVEMEKTPKGWFEGKVPKKAVTGKSLQFYFEGRNAAGKPVVSNGRWDSPNLMLLREDAAAEEAESQAPKAPGRDTDENPLDDRENTGPRLYLGKVDRSKIGLDARYGKRSWWIGLALGSGYGYAKGNGFEARTDLQNVYQAGLAWAGFAHLAGEIGYQISPDFAVSIQSRNQYIPQSARFSKYTAHGANSVLAKLIAFTRQQEVRLFGSLMAGGGEGFRLLVYPDDRNPDFRDTVRGGPLLAGFGGGINWEASHRVSLVAEVNLLAGFPIFSAVADLNLGLQVNIY